MENFKDFLLKINGAINELLLIVMAAVSGWAAIRASWYYLTEAVFPRSALKEMKKYGLVLVGILAFKAFTIFCIEPILKLIPS